MMNRVITISGWFSFAILLCFLSFKVARNFLTAGIWSFQYPMKYFTSLVFYVCKHVRYYTTYQVTIVTQFPYIVRFSWPKCWRLQFRFEALSKFYSSAQSQWSPYLSSILPYLWLEVIFYVGRFLGRCQRVCTYVRTFVCTKLSYKIDFFKIYIPSVLSIYKFFNFDLCIYIFIYISIYLSTATCRV